MLTIQNLHATVGESPDEKPILKGLNLNIQAGEVHAIMGPNGAGKSTLGQVLAGHDAFAVTGGTITFEGDNIADLSPAERAHAGLFLAFQYPVELAGVGAMNFLRTAYNSHRKAGGLQDISPAEFVAKAKQQCEVLELNPDFLTRDVNVGFSGGEKKRFEMLQMALLNPKLAILDETDSGLDIDALKTVASAVNAMRHANRAFIIITHYQRLLDYIKPDHVHVLADGQITKSGGFELAEALEKNGYEGVL